MITHIGLYTVGANIYDLKKLREKSKKKKRSRLPRQPLITVIIPAHNEEKCIRRTLNSVLSNTYPNLEVIVVNNGSVDNTSEVVKRYIKWLPRAGTKNYKPLRWQKRAINQRFLNYPINHRPVRLFSLSSNLGKAGALNYAMRKHVKGELVMALDGDTMLDDKAIANVVPYFKDRKVMGVAANVKIIESRTWLGILQRFEHMIGYRAKKFNTLINGEFIIGGVASTYRMSALKKVNFYDTDTMTEDIGLSLKMVNHFGNVNKKIVYASDVLAMTEGVQTFKSLAQQRYRWKMGNLQNIYKYRSLILNSDAKYSRPLTRYRLPVAILGEIMLLLEPVLIGYLIYLSIYYHTYIVLIGGYVTMTTYVFLTLWPDEHLKLKSKLKMSVYAFFVYILFYAMDVIQLSAIFRSIWAPRKIIGKKHTGSVWVSPVRSGQQATFS
jgi:cellulose synthase/poly-beta-1,6-N-acetylglucosamine synthase-like glycosyltransferase